MKDKRCFICKYEGRISPQVEENYIYRPGGKCQSVLLCYDHSVALFKMGQVNFLKTFKPDYSHFYGTEADNKIIDFFNLS
jgi:hypothetical protein